MKNTKEKSKFFLFFSKQFLNIGAIIGIIGIILAIYSLKEGTMLSLSPGEIISIIIAIGLGILNIIQYYKKRGIFKPISNSLVGLFNDVKDKIILCNGAKNRLWNPNYPYNESEAVKWDYDAYVFAMTQVLYGFQEHIVALLKSLDISDDEIFQAVTFGLSEEEKQQRKIYMKRFIEEQERAEKERKKKEAKQKRNKKK